MYTTDLDVFLQDRWRSMMEHPPRQTPYISTDINTLNERRDENFKVSLHGKYLEVREHKHNYFEMMYVYNGSITHIIDGNEIVLKKGDYCILDMNTVHAIKKTTSEDEGINFVMDKSFFSHDFLSVLSANKLFSTFYANALHKSNYANYIVVPTDDDMRIRDYSSKIMCEYFDPDQYSQDAINSLMLLLFNELMRIWKSENSDKYALDEPGNSPNIWAILRYIETNYKTVTLKSAANRFGYSPKYFSKILSDELGMSFIELKHDICMKQAAFLLINSDISVSEVASSVGFANYSFFYSLFKKQFGMTPAKFRQLTPPVE